MNKIKYFCVVILFDKKSLSQLEIDNRDIYCWWCFISCANKNLLQHELCFTKRFLNVFISLFLGENVFLWTKDFFKSSVVGALIDCWLWRIINDSTNSENCRVKNWICENVYISIIFEGGFHINLFRSGKAYKVEKHVCKRITGIIYILHLWR